MSISKRTAIQCLRYSEIIFVDVRILTFLLNVIMANDKRTHRNATAIRLRRPLADNKCDIYAIALLPLRDINLKRKFHRRCHHEFESKNWTVDFELRFIAIV